MVAIRIKIFLREGHQASKKEQLFKMVKWQPHGLGITTWVIKYPHIKKNAQHGNTPYYRASRPLSNSMLNWFVNILLGALITLAILAVIQIAANYMHYGWY